MKTLLDSLFGRKVSNSSTRAWRPSFENLEDRNLLSASPITISLSAGVLKINGSSQDDNILVKQVNGKISVLGVAGSYSAALVNRIEVNGFGGKDWINLDSVSLGGQAITKPATIRGGDQDDLILGTSVADLIFGEGGDDTMYGLNGMDTLNGGAGKDKAYGGAGNDTIVADIADLQLYGQAGAADAIVFQNLDPAPLASNNPAILQAAIQSGIGALSFSKTSNGAKFSVKDFEVTSVTINNGITTVSIKAKVRVQQFVFGHEVASTSGTLKFTLNPKLNATLMEALATSATIKMANVNVQEMNLNNVPNWMDNNSKVRDFLESKLAAQAPLNYTSQLQLFLAMGGSLGPAIQA